MATEVARANLDFATEARAIAAKLGTEVAEGERTFASAWDDAMVPFGTMQEKMAEVKAATAAKDAAKVTAAQAAVGTARNDAIAKVEEAMKVAGLAKPMAPDGASDDSLKDATKDQINHARYLLTYLLYDAQRFEDAAALGQFLVDQYPNAKGSRQAAKIAMSSLQQVGLRADGKARDAARANLARLTGVVMRVWPDDEVSADAASIAIAAAVAARDPAAIVAIIDQVPASSPRRMEVVLRAGPPLFREVQEARRSTDAAAKRDPKVIEAWKARARAALDEGLASAGTAASLPSGSLGTLAAAGALTRVQIAMEDDDTAKALAVLQHQTYGPWTLVTANSPVLQQGALAEAALTLSLRLFIQTEKFELAQQAMDGLEKVAGTGEEASAKLTAMYLSMGRDLQGQLEQLGSGKVNDPQVRAKAEKILSGFEKFLDRVASRDTKISSQFWVATTYLTLGSGQGTGAVVPKDKADRYLKRSADVYEKLLQQTQNPDVGRFEPSIRLRMANIYQELRQWDEAQKQMDWFLGDPKRQNSLETQIQAAELLQAAAADAAKNGDADRANTLYREAASGRKVPPVEIWGWGTIGKKLARQGLSGTEEKSRQARDAFFNANYRVAECLLARARLPGKEAEKKKRLDTAETVIAMIHKLYPDLGGADMTAKFDKVLKQVQQEKGVANPAGLAALDTPAGPQGGGE
jgi:tetratricopeptide (TPR) repeat protein